MLGAGQQAAVSWGSKQRKFGEPGGGKLVHGRWGANSTTTFLEGGLLSQKAKPSPSHKPLQPAAYALNEQKIVNAKQKRTLPPSKAVGFQVKLKGVMRRAAGAGGRPAKSILVF